MNSNNKFSVGEKVVYPSHGVGKILSIENQVVAGTEMSLYKIYFQSEKMTLHVPVSRAKQVKLRHLINFDRKDDIYSVLQQKPKVGNKMWSRRELDYRNKITSGDVISIAEVVRDLYKNINNDRSYSERTIYELSLVRLAEEISELENTSIDDAKAKLINILQTKTIASSDLVVG